MNYFRNNLVPAAAWLGLSLYLKDLRLDPLSLLFWLRALVVVWCFVVRLPASKRAPLAVRLTVWTSALLPTFMRWGPTWQLRDLPGLLLCVSGTTLVIISCIDLGKSFGISPALRAPVSEGIYKRIKHPMYLGHALTEVGILMVTPNLRNLVIAFVGWGFYLWRIQVENKFFIKQETDYSNSSRPSVNF